MFVFTSWLVSYKVLYSHTIWYREKQILNTKYLQELIKEDKMFKTRICHVERALTFDQWKAFSENYKPIRVWLWLVYQRIDNFCRLQLFSKLVPTQKRYPISLDKMRILTWKLLAISGKNIFCELSFERTYSLQNISYMSLRL